MRNPVIEAFTGWNHLKVLNVKFRKIAAFNKYKIRNRPKLIFILNSQVIDRPILHDNMQTNICMSREYNKPVFSIKHSLVQLSAHELASIKSSDQQPFKWY